MLFNTRSFDTLEEAAIAAAEQNYDRDARLKVVQYLQKPFGSWEEMRKMYTDEATAVLTHSGQNYLPEFPDHACIVWTGFKNS